MRLSYTGLFTNTYECDNPELARICAAGVGALVGVDRLYVARLAVVLAIVDMGALVRVEMRESISADPY